MRGANLRTIRRFAPGHAVLAAGLLTFAGEWSEAQRTEKLQIWAQALHAKEIKVPRGRGLPGPQYRRRAKKCVDRIKMS